MPIYLCRLFLRNKGERLKKRLLPAGSSFARRPCPWATIKVLEIKLGVGQYLHSSPSSAYPETLLSGPGPKGEGRRVKWKEMGKGGKSILERHQ